MRNFLTCCLLCLTTLATAQAPAGYYDTATGTGYTLKTQLHNIINGHSRQSYSAIWTFVSTYELDAYYENDGTVIDIYSENPSASDPYNYTKVTDQCGSFSGEGSCYNREHSFPASWFGGVTGSSMYTDIHHLFPTDGKVNSERGNFPYGEVGTATFTSQNGSQKGSAQSGLGYSGTVFEPIDEFKGDIARAYFYMATRYEDVIDDGSWSSDMLDGSTDQVFTSWALAMLLDWHTNDPVSTKETDRNNNAYTFQGNRNPFIDNPSWVNTIWGSGPAISLSSTNAIDFGNVVAGSSSSSTSYTVSGSNLEADITVTVSSPFEVSTDDATWSTSVTITQANAEAGTNNTVYVRFSPTTANGATSNGTIAHTSTNATTVNVSTTGIEGIVIAVDLDTLKFQSFESVAADTWTYTVDPTEGTFTASGDVWEVVSSVGSITGMTGSNFFGGRDINNGDNPNVSFATVDFGTVTTTGYSNVKILFDYNVVEFDITDDFEYEVSIDGVGQGVVTLVDGSGATSASGTETISIPDGSTNVSLMIKVTQNGDADYCGFDQVMVTGEAPLISLSSTDAIDFGSVSAGSSSSSSSYTVVGSNLEADITVSATSPFEVSSDDATWGTSITISQANAEAGTNNTVYVRFSPTTANGATSNENISHTSSNAATVNKSVTGMESTVVATELDTLAYQSFESSAIDTWTYTVDPTEGTFTASGDVWEVVSSVGSITGMTGSNFFGGRDINNADNPNTSFATVTFNTATLTNYSNVKVSFTYDVVGYDAGDNFEYEVSIDGVGQGTVALVTGAGNTNGSGTETINIPDGSTNVALTIKVTQDGGSDYCGFDEVMVTGEINVMTWDGSSNTSWGEASNWDGGVVPTSSDNVVIPSTVNNVIITDDRAVNDLEIQSGATVTVNSGAALAIFGEVSGTGQLIAKRNTTGSGGYSIMGSPVTSATVADLSARYVVTYDGSTWTAPTGTDPLTPGKGFFVNFNAASPEVTLTGTPNSGTITYGVATGEQLVANPYAAAISLEEFRNANSSVIDGTVYFWDDGGSDVGANRGGDYITVNNLGAVSTDNLSDGVSGSQGTAAALNGNMASLQGVFVTVTSAGNITFNPDMQVTTSSANSDGNYYRTTADEFKKIKLSLAGNQLYDETIIAFGETATYDNDFAIDSKKLLQDTRISLYSLQQEEKYAIQGLPMSPAEESTVVALGFDPVEAGEFTITVKEMEGLTSNERLFLVDHETKQVIALSENTTYRFAATEEVANNQRFQLIIREDRILSIEDEVVSTLSVYGTSSELTIWGNLQGKEEVMIYSLTGQVVFQDEIQFTNNQAQFKTTLSKNQIYILRVGNETVKLVVN